MFMSFSLFVLQESKSSVPPPLLPVAKPDTSSSSTSDKNSPAPVTQKVTYVSPLDSYVVDGYILVPKGDEKQHHEMFDLQRHLAETTRNYYVPKPSRSNGRFE